MTLVRLANYLTKTQDKPHKVKEGILYTMQAHTWVPVRWEDVSRIQLAIPSKEHLKQQ